RESAHRRGDAAAAIGDDSRARERAGGREAFSQLFERPEDPGLRIEKSVVEHVVTARNVPGTIVDVFLSAVDVRRQSVDLQVLPSAATWRISERSAQREGRGEIGMR